MTASRTVVVVVGLVAIVVAIAVGGFVAYSQVLRGDAAPALTLPSAATGTAASSSPAASFDGVVAGTWAVASGSQAGYRVREQLASLPAASDAVGRTDKVTGSITVTSDATATTVTAGELTVDTTSITSDESRRDNRMRTDGLQTDSFPTATFKLTQPMTVPAAAVAGTASDITLVGDLTIHGVTKSVQVPAKAQLANGQIQVAGSISVPLSDYGMTAPVFAGFIISVEDHGALEFSVVFDKS